VKRRFASQGLHAFPLAPCIERFGARQSRIERFLRKSAPSTDQIIFHFLLELLERDEDSRVLEKN
jgi:hypothetical protein